MGWPPLFNLELWERFSYLGFQAILALYFADSIVNGGLGYDQTTASSIVAVYGALGYLLSIVGAWVADRISGTYRAVLWGGTVIAAGHIAMGVPTELFTWIGLGLIVVGTGLLKPNLSSMVGELYSKADERRDAGFSIYYSGINIGAFLGPLVAGGLGQTFNWHYGFMAAAVGMILGLIQYVRGSEHLAGRERNAAIRAAFRPDRHFWTTVGLGVAVVVLAVLFAVFSGQTLAGALMSSLWMVLCYVFIGLGGLILQTSGMSATTKLAPRAFASQTMALWMAAMALSQGIQAQIVKLFSFANAAVYFGVQGAAIVAYGLFLVALTPWMAKRINFTA